MWSLLLSDSWSPLVTAMVPAFNGQDFIQRTLDSIDVQTWKNLEILIADDCSTDGTLSIIEAFARDRPHVKVIAREKNLGWLMNSNDLMKRSTGELIFFAFHDDVIAPNYIEKLVHSLTARPDAIMAYSDFELFTPRMVRTVGRLKSLAGRRSILGRGLTMIERPEFWGAPNRGLFRRWVFEKIGGMRENAAGDFSADWPWLVHMSLLGNFVRVPELLVKKYYKWTSKTKAWRRELTPEKWQAMWDAALDEVWRADVPLAYRLIIIVYARLNLRVVRAHIPLGVQRVLGTVTRLR